MTAQSRSQAQALAEAHANAQIRVQASVPPPRELMLLEMRAIGELGAFFSMYPLLRRSPRGDGHPVLVLPGFLASDTSTVALRGFLRDRGYRVHGWRMGSNLGAREGVIDGAHQRLIELHERYQRKVTVMGWSLGGIFARELARREPDRVRGVITLGSPIGGHHKSSNIWQLYERVAGHRIEGHPLQQRLSLPVPVPATSIYTRTDGIVAWQGCREPIGPQTENIEVDASHCGIGHHPAALFAVADRLAQAEGQWRPFERTGWRRVIFPDPYRDTPAPR